MSHRKGAQQVQHAPMGHQKDERAGPALLPQVQDHIGRQLRAVYDDVLQQPVPDRFRELLEKLDTSAGEDE